MPLRDALDLLEFFLFEPIDNAYHQGLISRDDYDSAVWPLMNALHPSSWAGTLVALPDGRTVSAPSWWDEDDYERGVAMPDDPALFNAGSQNAAAVAAAWSALRGDPGDTS